MDSRHAMAVQTFMLCLQYHAHPCGTRIETAVCIGFAVVGLALRWRRWKRKGAVVVVAVNNKEEVALFVVAVDPYS